MDITQIIIEDTLVTSNNPSGLLEGYILRETKEARNSPESQRSRTIIAMIIVTGSGSNCANNNVKVISRSPKTDMVKKPTKEIVPERDHMPMTDIKFEEGRGCRKLITAQSTIPPNIQVMT